MAAPSKKPHPGFKKVQATIAKKQGISKKAAGAILAAGARKASTKAVKANPRLKRVSGVIEKKTNETYKSKAAMKRHEAKETPSQRKKEYGKSYKKGKK